MKELAQNPLQSYSKDELPLSESEISTYLDKLPGWAIQEREGIPRLEKSYKFDNFLDAVEFTNQVAELAEAAEHHPAILVSWGRTAVSWWTHFHKRLHINDFTMAARTEMLYRENNPDQ
jgi:4a-hydroxytetrahydrobiopterin dehydratase